jgi:hypothetical protein
MQCNTCGPALPRLLKYGSWLRMGPAGCVRLCLQLGLLNKYPVQLSSEWSLLAVVWACQWLQRGWCAVGNEQCATCSNARRRRVLNVQHYQLRCACHLMLCALMLRPPTDCTILPTAPTHSATPYVWRSRKSAFGLHAPRAGYPGLSNTSAARHTRPVPRVADPAKPPGHPMLLSPADFPILPQKSSVLCTSPQHVGV